MPTGPSASTASSTRSRSRASRPRTNWRRRPRSTRSFACGASSACDAISEDPQEFHRDPLDELLVRWRERVQLVRVDVDLRDRGAVSEDWHDHFRPCVDEALEVPRVVVHVRHDDRRLVRHGGPADAFADRDAQVQGRAGPGPGGEDQLRSVHVVDSDPRVVRDLPQLPADEVGDRLALAPGMDDLLEASGDLVVTDLALLASHDFAELPDSLHVTRLSIERSGPP